MYELGFLTTNGLVPTRWHFGRQVRRAGSSLLTGTFIDLMCKIVGNPGLVDIPG